MSWTRVGIEFDEVKKWVPAKSQSRKEETHERNAVERE